MTSLDYDRLVRLLNELGDELRSVRANGAVYIVGGSAMVLAGNTENRVTHDVDAQITHGHGHVVNAVRKVGHRHDLPGSWLNEQVTPYLSPNPDQEATLVFAHPNLVVTAASPSRLLAMKLMAGRAQDIDDVRSLLRRTKLEEDALQLLVTEAIMRSTLGRSDPACCGCLRNELTLWITSGFLLRRTPGVCPSLGRSTGQTKDHPAAERVAAPATPTRPEA